MIVSSIEGRIRFVDENIKKPEVADKIDKLLKDIDGIKEVRLNIVIGSLLINYDQDNISSNEIIRILEEDIDTSLRLHKTSSQKNNLIDGAVEVFKNQIGLKASRKDKGKGSSSNNGSNLLVENITGNKIIKGALYSVLGVQGYKKGKGLMKGQGKGKRN